MTFLGIFKQHSDLSDHGNTAVAHLFRMLGHTTTGASIMQWMAKNDIDIAHDETYRGDGEYRPEQRKIYLDLQRPSHETAGTMVRLAREAWQIDKGLVPNIVFDPHTFIVQQRFLLADRLVYETAARFEMRMHDGSAWEPFREKYFAMAFPYFNEAQVEPLVGQDNLTNGHAMFAAMRKFFTDSRMRGECDAASIRLLEEKKAAREHERDMAMIETFDASARKSSPILRGLEVSTRHGLAVLGESLIQGRHNYLSNEIFGDRTATMIGNPAFTGPCLPMYQNKLRALQK